MRIAAAVTTVLLLGACSPSGETGAEPHTAPEPASAPQPGAQPPQVIAAVPAGSHAVSGRTVTVSLPFRAADNLAWVTATKMAEARPFVFKALDVQPGKGPGGADLAVFTYGASGPGHAVLNFGLIPAGRTLVGPEDQIFKGEVVRTYSADVTVE
jgi:hypothetical protein